MSEDREPFEGANDNRIGWRIEGPDAEGDVRFVHTWSHGHAELDLGKFDDVATRLADWLAQQDFGER